MLLKNKPKIITFYLPQYHEIEENNKWWGQGFTEWENVKKAQPLYRGHYQPKVPLKKNYYNLLNPKTIKLQADIAQNYGVDGFCFYHYWFRGKKLLEKPLEMILSHPEINIEYCLSWANETWSRRWNGQERDILIKQEYGDKEDWDAHFQYLINFFKDPRYIKINNKPILLLYRTFEINQYDKMISYWNQKAIEEGFSGIYIVETLNSAQKKGYAANSSAYVEFEPMYTVYKYLRLSRRIYRYVFKVLKLSRIGLKDYLSYDLIWKYILHRKRNYNKQTFLGAFPSWDNTARKGKAGLVIKKSTPQKFERYFLEQYKKSIELGNEFIFINAWNEWGEGAYLEPDEKHRFAYLQAIKNVKDIF